MRVYVACNTLPREDELAEIPPYLAFLQDAGVDALIIADIGMLELAKRYAPRVKRHVSTQLGVINSATANALTPWARTRSCLHERLRWRI